MLRTFLSNSKGVSLIQGMVISATLAGGALVTTKLLQEQKMSLNDASTRTHIEQLNELIFSILENQANCTETLRAAFPSGVTPGMSYTFPAGRGILNAGNPTPAYTLYSPADPVNTTYLDGNVAIRSIQLFTDTNIFERTQTNDIQTMNITGGNRIVIQYERLSEGGLLNLRQREGSGAKNINKAISIQFQGTPGNYTCFAAKDQNWELLKEMCENVKFDTTGLPVKSLFQWDDTTNTCKPRNNVCPSQQVYVGINSLGNVICRDLKDQMNMATIFDTSKMTCANSANVKLKVYFDGGLGHNRVRLDCGTGTSCVVTGATPARTWTASGNNCSAPLTVGTHLHGKVLQLKDPSSPGFGKARYECVNGAWVQLPGSSCAPSGCATVTKLWNDGTSTHNCTADLPDYTGVHTGGLSYTLYDDAGNHVGTKNFSCNATGTWNDANPGTCARVCKYDVRWGCNGTDPEPPQNVLVHPAGTWPWNEPKRSTSNDSGSCTAKCLANPCAIDASTGLSKMMINCTYMTP